MEKDQLDWSMKNLPIVKEDGEGKLKNLPENGFKVKYERKEMS